MSRCSAGEKPNSGLGGKNREENRGYGFARASLAVMLISVQTAPLKSNVFFAVFKP